MSYESDLDDIAKHERCSYDGAPCNYGCVTRCVRAQEEARRCVTGYESLGQEIGKLVESKQRQYGDSAGKSGGIMRILYPNGVKPHQMDDALLTVRVLDKLSRIAQRGEDGKDLGGESPWKDCAGYGILGWKKDIENGASE